MFTHLARHVKDTLENLNFKKFVSACGFNRTNTRIFKSNFGICHQFRNHVSCAENSGVRTDNERCGKSKKDSWKHSIHLEHSPIGLLGWSTALAIGWCMTQPFYRQCVLPSDKSNWDQAHILTKTVFAQPGVGLTKLDRYLKYNATDTVFTQSDTELNDEGNSVSKSEDITLLKEEDISPLKAGDFSVLKTEDISLLKTDDISLSQSGSLSERQSEFSFESQSESGSGSQSESSSGSQSGYSSGSESEYSSRSQSGISSGNQSGYSSGRESEYCFGSQAKKSFGSQPRKRFGSQAKKNGTQAKKSFGSQSMCNSQSQAKDNSGNQAKGSSESQEKTQSEEKFCCGSELSHLRLREAAETLEVVQNLFSSLDNHLGVIDIKSGNTETAVGHFANAVELGNSKSMFNMGLCYEMGLGVEQNLTQAATYYRMAARRGHLTAVYNLGVFHIYGLGDVTKDLKCALKHFEYAAKHGQKEAKNAYSSLSSYLKKKRSHERETDCESNTLPVSSTLTDRL